MGQFAGARLLARRDCEHRAPASVSEQRDLNANRRAQRLAICIARTRHPCAMYYICTRVYAYAYNICNATARVRIRERIADNV